MSTHVLDAARGVPAAGVEVALYYVPNGAQVSTATTDADGRAGALLPNAAGPGDYRIVFGTGAYFAATGQQGFYPEVAITFTVTDPDAHYHVPLLLSPYSYSTYRGS
ncbi:hydroxyisourate hydrolase [Aldersonia sp. NBC_00410]|uniref:hydroxyisourate hydrolase n=1 Tax=Aldersonia sp. NBC_00410 TaxID=2975954 RepID=UPI002257558E|nr:hydroxyisourate hydrolase [Aldersonia sp. NBC_00410]MCX5044504.1 hydroxyisourate hydrolase [Aldersonia sp. NBC_00410]